MGSFLQSYDLAVKLVLYSKFASILEINAQSSSIEENINLGIFQFPKEVALRVAAEKRGQTYLEFINFWRMGASFSWSRNRSVLSRRGMWLSNAEDGLDTVHVKAVPIDLNYNAWFWSKDLDKMYQVMEDYVFWQQDNPKVTIKYDDIYTLEPDLHFGEIVDESTVDEQYSQGITYVYKMPIKVDAWALKEGLSLKTIHKIQITFYDKDYVTEYEKIVGEDPDTELEAALRFFRRMLYRIFSVDKSNKSFTIAGGYVTDFTERIGEKFRIENSTGNDGIYTIVSATLVSGKTVVVVEETISSSVADGHIHLES